MILAHKDADGRVDYLSTIARDISERKHIEQLRQEYLQAMSHDLRSPLSAISAQARLLKATLVEGRSEADARRSLAAIRRGVARMAEMLQDLAQSVRMEGACPQLERRPIHLGPFVADLLAGGLVAHSERVRLEVPPDCLEVHADADFLARILSNLLGNALKFSPPASGVLVTAHPEGDDVVVSVADEGPGVAAADLPRIFERFYRAGEARGIEGLGLGLYITRKLVEAHAGRIWVDSGTGRGATFRFTLPGCPPDSPAA